MLLLKNLCMNIYEKELCISPIPSLAIHFTNINSIFGLSPNVDCKKIWEENNIKRPDFSGLFFNKIY